VECLYCKGRLTLGTTPFTLERNGYHVTWDAIPAWVCTQCGEPLFEASTVELMQEALASLDRQTAALVSASGPEAPT
jgi:YgiT-type zinc finger domain-containing protein